MNDPASRGQPTAHRVSAALRRLKDLVEGLGGVGLEAKAWTETDLPDPPPETREERNRRILARTMDVDIAAASAVRDQRIPQLNA